MKAFKVVKTLSGAIMSAILLSSCVAPINSSFETARLLEPGDIEVTGAYDRYSYGGDGESELANNNLTARAGIGVTDWMDVKLRYTRLMPPSDDFEESMGVNYMDVAPKFGIVPDYFAISLPIGCYFEGGAEWVTSPKLLFTYPHKSNIFDATLGAKADIFFSGDTYLGFTFGMGFSSDVEQWAVRPEIGYLIDPGESGHVFSWGVGLVYNFRKVK